MTFEGSNFKLKLTATRRYLTTGQCVIACIHQSTLEFPIELSAGHHCHLNRLQKRSPVARQKKAKERGNSANDETSKSNLLKCGAEEPFLVLKSWNVLLLVSHLLLRCPEAQSAVQSPLTSPHHAREIRCEKIWIAWQLQVANSNSSFGSHRPLRGLKRHIFWRRLSRFSSVLLDLVPLQLFNMAQHFGTACVSLPCGYHEVPRGPT